MTTERVVSICRICNVDCPVVVELDRGRVTKVTGDRTNAFSAGYTCVKGRSQPAYYDHPDRLLHSLKRQVDGSFAPIPVEEAMDEIAERLETLIATRGPRSIAFYFGTLAQNSQPTIPMMHALGTAIGTPMQFNPGTIDKPGKTIARAMLGGWMAPTMGYDAPNVGLLIGLNPFVSYQGIPKQNVGKWLSDAQRRGFKLIVIDPRRNDAAKRAFLHLQPRPGTDVAILAGMVRIILDEGLYDAPFVADHVAGLDALCRAVDPFVPSVVAERADISRDDLLLAARTFAGAGRAYAWAGTGANFNASGTLVEYLTLCLITLCGYYLREGDRVLNPRTFAPALAPRAQATPPRPAYGFGEHLRVRGLANTAAGMPTAALADEILLPGEGQVRALICDGGNPVSAYPDQIKTVAAMRDLDLLVQVDPWMSTTAQLAHYVIATKFGFEIPGINFHHDRDAAWGTAGYGRPEAFGQYTPALIAPPEGSELIEDWELYFGLAQRMGLPLELRSSGIDALDALDAPLLLDCSSKPTSDELIEWLSAGSRIALDEVKRHPGGAAFPDPAVTVAPGDPECRDRMDVGNVDMMEDLRTTAGEVPGDDHGFDLRLITRRITSMMNSAYNVEPANHGRYYNPAFLHSDDLAARGLRPGDLVRIVSARAGIVGEVQPDDTLRRGLVSMTHCYGGTDDIDADTYRRLGSNTSRLLSPDDPYERYSGQPLMNNIPVRLEPITEDQHPVTPSAV